MTSHLVIGTAGHIDHGKTELVKALTGIDTDRLAEEKERGISIDLGFASFWLPSGIEAAIVDVPGHEKFVRNMLAGATGIDLFLLVVAADDGVMAQTIEHLAIAELLGIPAAVIAVTKMDLVDEAGGAAVVEQVRELIEPGSFSGAPIVKVSAKNRYGLDELIAAIETRSEALCGRLIDYPARLPIDRSFILPGAGRVVTGTLWSGVLTATDTLELLPSGQTCRPRRLEIHGNAVTKALAGQRVAINIVVPGPPPRRGDFLVAPATFMPATELLARIRVLPQAAKGVKRRTRLRLYHGTKEIAATVSPIGVPVIGPGETGYVRILPDEPVAAVFRDRFVLRRRSPVTTIGGGVVLEARQRRDNNQVGLSHVEALAGDDRLAIKEFLRANRLPLTAEEIAAATQLGGKATDLAIAGLAEAGEVTALGVWQPAYYLDAAVLAECAAGLRNLLEEAHAEHPFQFGLQKEAAHRRLWPELSSSHADIIYDYFTAAGLIVAKEGKLALAARSKAAGAAEKAREVRSFLSGFSPPEFNALVDEVALDPADLKAILSGLIAQGDAVAITSSMYFLREAIDEATSRLLDYLAGAGEITISRFKDLLGTTRKYAVPLMEYFDREKITRRNGDVRVIYELVAEEDESQST